MAKKKSGDLGDVHADASLAESRFAWKAERSLEEMCEDLWRWQQNNPNGYKS